MAGARAAALALAGALVGLGALFTARPRWGAAVFGLPPGPDAQLDHLRALGFRDFAVALSLAGAAALGRRPLAIVAASSAVIPTLDLALVAQRRGAGAAPQLALHGISALALGFITALAVASPRR